MGFDALQTDGNKNPIQGGNKIGTVIEVTTNTSTFVAITIPAGIYSKKLYFNARDNTAYQLSAIVAGTTYSLIAASSPFWLDITAVPGDVIGYVKGTTITVLEVIVLV